MRDYLILTVILACLPIGLMVPFFGLMVYTWISYMVPHMHAWGVATTFPVAKLSAITALSSAVLFRGGTLSPLIKRESILMVMLWVIFTFSSVFSFNPVDAWQKWEDVSKLIVMALLTATMLTTRERFRYFFLVVGLSLGFYGFKGGIFSLATGGQYMVWGPDTSVIAGNNNIGLAMNMALPILWYMSHEEKGWLKRLLQLTFFLTIPAILFTYSRASALTVPIVLIPMVLKGRNRIFLLVALLVGALAAVPYIPERWWNRQESTLEYEQDKSANSRLDLWKFSWQVAVDRPITGGGFRFYSSEVIRHYQPDFIAKYNRAWDTHSIYFGILASHGFPGFFLWSTMIFSCYFSCWRMRRLVKHRPDLAWISTSCNIITVSLLGFLANGAFVNMEYFDLPFHWVAVVASLRVACAQALSSEEPVVENTMQAELVAS